MNIKVAIFDDNKNLLDSLFQLINGSSGFECVGAFPNCNELINDLIKSKPDVVLMDIEMPGMSGIEAVLVIKSNFPKVKILMETIFEDDEKVFATICNGAEGYILKNIEPAELLTAIKTVLTNKPYYSNEVAVKLIENEKTKTKTVPPDKFGLTDRELLILKMIALEMSNDEIANSLSVAKRTIDSHRQHLLLKLNAKNTVFIQQI